MQSAGFVVNIIPYDWFEKWKSYTYFNELVCENRGAAAEMMDEEKSITNETTKESIDIFEHPGPIDIKELLDENSVDFAVDPDRTKDYTNFILK
jgi:hypothetical protein